MRKKQLRAENFRLAVELGETQAELADVKAHRDVLDSENTKLSKANVALSGRLNEALAANRRFAAQQRTQNELFGEALATVKCRTGPSRPNRKKLTDREVRDIRDAYYGGARQKELAEKYGVNPATISRTVRGVYH
ncbi:hypothetical protein SEA_ARCHERNM_43 [Mycobacterium phage ArcherNM]|uniref:HTH DNA binding protein n=1 Tax=Mycobacterium phage ArcherNM TaxID=1815972 RepID=UPI00078B91C9|nr:HTH DNA binding protein [Mycobacterium phage ArcherNM]AMS01037.1 hypothetical protein SEA_ARCHERNM_43 [Mycobacterium phage ArcherNM]